MSEAFLAQKLIKLAMLAAFWSLHKILKVQLKVRDVAMSFANVLKLILLCGKVEKFRWLQDAALLQVSRSVFSSELDLGGLTMVAKLYNELMKCQ